MAAAVNGDHVVGRGKLLEYITEVGRVAQTPVDEDDWVASGLLVVLLVPEVDSIICLEGLVADRFWELRGMVIWSIAAFSPEDY